MTYNINNIIEAKDFNTFVSGAASGPNVNTVPNVGSVLGTGYGDVGYGQAVPNRIAINSTIAAGDWASLIAAMYRAGQHQNSAIAPIATPLVYTKISYQPKLESNINTIYANRLNAVSQGTVTTQSLVNDAASIPWTELTYKINVNFLSGDHARYFFNSGGQLKLNFSHTGSSSTDPIFNNLAANIGTLIFSSTNTNPITIGNTKYPGFSTSNGVPVVLPPPPVSNVVCISVIDEDSSYSASTSQSDWNTFRNTHPTRNFYLLQPLSGKSVTGQNLKIPPTFKTDTKAFGPIRVNRDEGVVSSRSDWFALCNLAAAPPNTTVALSIDNSGSMTTKTVQASYNYFMQQCAAAKISVIFNVMQPFENWISWFITNPSTTNTATNSSPVTLFNSSVGYYSLTTTPQTIFRQVPSNLVSLATYKDSSITLAVSSNGSQGLNGDTGNVITFTVTWTIAPKSTSITGISTVNCTVVNPETTYLDNTWGTVTTTMSKTSTNAR